MKKTLSITVSLLLILIISHCQSKKLTVSPETSSSDEALFKLGQSYLKKDAERARLIMRQVIESFPKSFYAQRAKLAIADTYFAKKDEGNLILAAAEYKEFISLYPSSPSVAYAQYRIGLCFYEKASKPGRDQQKTRQALAEFKKIVTNYPLAEEVDLTREKIKECENRLAEHTFQIGYHYYRVRSYPAAISRLSEILTNFPEFSGMDKVYFYLGDSYNRGGKIEESIPYFTKIVSDYPKSKYAKKAQNCLKEIENTKREEKK
ncbi:MAG: outer membrane protein assembly factor BamD [Candidatus Aminicenantales bacterium]